MKITGLAIIILAMGLIASNAFAGEAIENEVITWNVDEAVAAGSGCSMDDTSIIVAGDQISVIFSNIGIELNGSKDTRLVTRKNCSVVIPAKVKHGWYIGKVEQTLMYGYKRTAGAIGSVSMVSRFFNYVAGKISKQIPVAGKDEFAEPQLETRSKSYLSTPSDRWCKYRDDYKGNYIGSLSLTGSRKSVRDSIVIRQIDGKEDIRFDAVVHGYACE